MQMKKGFCLLILVCQFLMLPQAVQAQSEPTENQPRHNEFIADEKEHESLRKSFDQLATENPAFRVGLEVYWQFLENDAIQIRDITELDGTGSSQEEVLARIETEVAPDYYEQNEETGYLLYVFDVPAGDNTGHNHLAELIVFFTDDQLEYIGLSSVTMNFNAANVIAETDAIAYSEPGTSLESVLSLNPVFVGIGHNRFKGETYTTLSYPSFAGFDDIMYEFTLFNQAEEVIYNYIVNNSSRSEQPSTYLMTLSQEYFQQTVDQGQQPANEATSTDADTDTESD